MKRSLLRTTLHAKNQIKKHAFNIGLSRKISLPLESANKSTTSRSFTTRNTKGFSESSFNGQDDVFSRHMSIQSINRVMGINAIRSFSTSVLVMQNEDSTNKENKSAFNNMMDSLFVKVKKHDVAQQDLAFTNFYDLDSEIFVDPKLDPNNRTVTENGAPTFVASGSNLVDFFYFTVSGISQKRIHNLLDASWREEPLKTLKVIFFIRDIRNGKGENEIFYETQRWLAMNHPKTFLENIKHIPTSGYWKDLQNLLLYIRYGGHERDERPSVRIKQSKLLLKRLPSAKGLYEQAMYKKRHSRNSRLEETIALEDFQPTTMWSEEIQTMDKLILTKDESKKLKVVYEKAKEIVVDLYVNQLSKDKESNAKGEHITLCAKWAPTVNLSADRQLGIAKKIATKLFPFEQPGGIYLTNRKEGKGDKNYTDLQVYRYLANIKYQKLLRDLRKATVTIETFMSAKEWSKIPYERVPSICMHTNKKLFSKKDNQRFDSFLESVKKGEKKINGSVLLPHLLVEQYFNGGRYDKTIIDTMELQWKEIVKSVKEKSNQGVFNCIPVCDVSGSMNGIPLNVAIGLSLIMSELNTGIYNSKIITFSENPSFVDLSGIESLTKRIDILKQSPWGYNTNYLATFRMILDMALKNNLPKYQMIKKVVVFSDMQFDHSSADNTSHQELVEMFAKHGYEAPGIVYWNLNGDNSNIPITVNTDNVACISGFNPTLLRMMMDMDLSVERLVETSLAKNYDFVTLHD